MINTFKNFTKKKLAGILLIIVIIIAFGFGGFGGGFNTGNQNNIAKINNTNITTQDFMDYLNSSGLSQQVIKENIDKNIIEELLSTLISATLLDLEVQDLSLRISEEVLIKKLRKNKNFLDEKGKFLFFLSFFINTSSEIQNFLDEKGKFQRTLYEKFLLTNNITAPIYELKLKKNVLQKQLFTYISGGTKSPNFFVNKYYKEKNRKLNIEYINLNKFYKKIDEFTEEDIKIFVNENSEKLKQEYIDFSYIVITPKNLTGLEEFNQAFFDKIDDIENKISKNINFNKIISELNILPTVIENYINVDNKESIENKIYGFRKDKIEILEYENSYIFYQINKTETKLPNLSNIDFKKKIMKLLFQKEKFDYNKKIFDQIAVKSFNQVSFDKLSIDGIKKIQLKSIEDDDKFEINSIKVLYSLPINSFLLIADENNNAFIAKTIKFVEQNLSKNSEKFKSISNESSAKNRNSILKSYDYLLNDKYNVVVNEKTLDRVKNYFR